MVEQGTENPRVVGSIPTGGTSGRKYFAALADLAHLVERDLAKVEVAGSSPVIRSIDLGVAQLVARDLGVVEAASSSLVTQTKIAAVLAALFFTGGFL